MGSLPVARLGRACSGLLRVLPAVAGSLPFTRHGPGAGAGLSSLAGKDSTPAVAIAERTRWTLGARAPTSASEELKPDLVATYLSETCMSKMEINTLAMRSARASNARHASDTGSSEVQVSILTQRILYMTEHLRAHPKDKHSRLGLMAMLSHRKKLLQYLRRTDGDRYQKLISGLGLKDIQGGER